ncbi:DASS family sodium-coupled anion symporter [Mesosutterella sp. AGMB02718]|uniref:DASS family sodium-coupled anion symporter n=1 Tax=Mesosutterella faecium TaxID=2925194 RepID=A0ABT7IRD7_9BURK|nr:DASS family sodium-coupled anion symporter [Mesosutterella sp. AGMB02718]MDL2059871.1 DASS family sodium-coupled anion symporter [Mesosutterella sp. AGMB02718]
MTTAASSPARKPEYWRWIVPVAVGLAIWFLPPPSGLDPKAIHMLGLFVGTIVGILCAPLPSGAIMMIALALSYFSGTLTLGQALSGLSSGTVWMIFSAYVLSLGFVQSGLGRRIAYLMLSKFGGSTTGIAYSLGVADLLMAPAMPSVTARSGGIILPVAKSILSVMGSGPGPTGRKIGDYLIMTCFQFTPITGALFLTGMAANPLCAKLAHDALGIDISWGMWLWAALLPALICFAILPHVTRLLLRPTLNKTPEAKQLGRDKLSELGPMTRQEKLVGIGFVIALIGWATTMVTGYNANAIGLGVVAYLLIVGAIAWKDVLAEKAAWDTVIWFGVIISLAGGLTKLGFIKWMSASVAAQLVGADWLAAFVILGFAYIYLHYIFATASGHVAAMYVPFCAVAIGCGAPALMVAVCFGIFSNFMWGITEYAGGPGPIYFGQGYFERPRFYRINFLIVTLNVLLVFVTGLGWWKVIGLY